MTRQNKHIDWNGVQDSELQCWYYVSKIMGVILPGDFPYYTYMELWKQITEDPEYKKKET